MDARNVSAGAEMSFLEHLEEFRGRLIKCIITVFVLAVGGYYTAEYVISFLTSALPHGEQRLIFLGPTDAFLIRLKTAVLMGVVAGLPVVFYQLWAFVAPGLYRKEKRYLGTFVLFATLFFLGGMAFSFYLVLPLGIRFLLGFQTDALVARLAVTQYFGFVFKLFIAFGTVFELPLLAFCLAKMGIVTSAFIREKRRYAYVLIFILAALLTPPDIFTQTVMALPLLLLYEISVWVAKAAE